MNLVRELNTYKATSIPAYFKIRHIVSHFLLYLLKYISKIYPNQSYTNARVGYHLHFIDSNFDSAYQLQFLSIPSFDSNKIKFNIKNEDKHLNVKHLFCVFLQSILLQLNNMSKNQQPTEYLGLQFAYAFNKNTTAKTTKLI